MSLFDSEITVVPQGRAAKMEQFNPHEYFGGVTFWDNYYQHSPTDSELWLKLFTWADTIDRSLTAALMMIRNTGAQLIRSSEFGFEIRPVIGPNGWASKAEYDREKTCLFKYRDQMVAMLARLRKEAGF